MTKKIILDLDTGIDDAFALAWAVADPEIELIGVISSYGNTLVTTAAQNTLNLLHLLNADDVPVFLGESHSISTNDFSVMPISKDIHGKNGIGDVQIASADRKIEQQSGVSFLIESAKKYQDELIYIPTGPLTNLAKAIQKDETITEILGSVVLMGGALIVPGNVTPFSEANIHQDPQAAQIVFEKQKNILMVGLDVTLKTLLTTKETKQWRTTKIGNTFADIMDYYIDAYDQLGINSKGAALHDPLAVAASVHPQYLKTFEISLKVTTDKTTGDFGRTIGDSSKLLDATTTKSAYDVDEKKFVADFQKLLIGLFENN